MKSFPSWQAQPRRRCRHNMRWPWTKCGSSCSGYLHWDWFPLHGEFHGHYSPWGNKESNTMERLSLHHFTMSMRDSGRHFDKYFPLQEPSKFSSVQSLSRVRLFADPWIAVHKASLSIIISQRSLKLMSIESVMPSSHLIFCRLPLVLPPIPPSIRVFSNQPTLRMRWPKYWSFSFSIIPSKEHQGLISSRMAWLDLLAVQWTLKSLLQHHTSKASILWCSASSQSNSHIHTLTTRKS